MHSRCEKATCLGSGAGPNFCQLLASAFLFDVRGRRLELSFNRMRGSRHRELHAVSCCQAWCPRRPDDGSDDGPERRAHSLKPQVPVGKYVSVSEALETDQLHSQELENAWREAGPGMRGYCRHGFTFCFRLYTDRCTKQSVYVIKATFMRPSELEPWKQAKDGPGSWCDDAGCLENQMLCAAVASRTENPPSPAGPRTSRPKVGPAQTAHGGPWAGCRVGG